MVEEAIEAIRLLEKSTYQRADVKNCWKLFTSELLFTF